MELLKERRKRATELASLLHAAEDELDASVSPNYRAMQALGVNQNGWCSRLYSDEAESIWKDLLRVQSGDTEVLHHLAILHHARAFDVEQTKDASKADADWEAANAVWRELLGHDGFWSGLAAVLGPGGDIAVEQVRRDWPTRLLQIHYDLAFDPKTPAHRAKFHVQLAKRLGHSDVLDLVRTRTYERLTNDLPDGVWDGKETEQSVLIGAEDRMLRILEIDPGCQGALHDSLRIQDRILTLRLQELRASSEHGNVRKAILTALSADAKKWGPYIDGLLADPATLPYDIREKLFTWLRVMGDAQQATHDFRAALGLYEKATPLVPSIKKVVSTLGESIARAHVLLARQMAENKSAGVEKECKEALRRDNLSPWCYARLAEAYIILEDFESALKCCRLGVTAVPGSHLNPDDIAEFESSKDSLKDVELQSHIAAAAKKCRKSDYNGAIASLKSAEAISDSRFDIYFLRIQCYVGLENPPLVRQFLDKCISLANSKEEKDALAELTKFLNRGILLQPRKADAALINEIVEGLWNANFSEINHQLKSRAVKDKLRSILRQQDSWNQAIAQKVIDSLTQAIQADPSTYLNQFGSN